MKLITLSSYISLAGAASQKRFRADAHTVKSDDLQVEKDQNAYSGHCPLGHAGETCTPCEPGFYADYGIVEEKLSSREKKPFQNRKIPI